MRSMLIMAAASTGLPVAGLLASIPLDQLGNVTATAMLGWYAWHTAAHTIPELVESFRDELAAERSTHRGYVEQFFNDLAIERKQRHTDQLALKEALRDAIRELVERSPGKHGN